LHISLGFSPCPNDTFIFGPLIKGLIESPFSFKEVIDDIEGLNEMALNNKLDISKVSCHVLGYIADKYYFLPVGAALGHGCGPLLVSKNHLLEELPKSRVAVPGRFTTAYLLLMLYNPSFEAEFVPFNEIMQAVKEERFDFGLIIHEGRFLLDRYGLKTVLDLGKWWEEKTKLPLPLGGIVARRSFNREFLDKLIVLIKKSIEYAFSFPEDIKGYIKEHASYLEDDVINEHIRLYVNNYTMDLGDEGREAIRMLFLLAKEKGIFKKALPSDIIY